MIGYPTLVALLALGLGDVAGGVAMLPIRRARPAAALMTLSGCGLATGSLLAATGNDGAARLALVIASALLAPLALTLYPSTQLRRAVDFLAMVTVAAAGLLASAWPDDAAVLSAMGLVIGCVLLIHTWWKIERADADDRRALMWMALAASLAGTAVFIVGFMQLGTAGQVVAWLTLAGVPAAMAIGLRRPDLVDVRGLVVELTVLGTAGTGYVALFMIVESLLEILGGSTPTPATLAVVGAAAAASFHPLRVLLRGVMDELLFGARPDPLGAAARVAGQVGDDPVLALRAIREALVLPYAALRTRGGTVASSGAVTTHTRSVRLDPGGDTELVVGLRPGDLTLTATDRRVLALVAPLLGQTMRARALAADLSESRGQTIAALEEERRRLRRDLHDGLGPRLSGIAFTADAAGNLMGTDPAGAGEMLRALRAETATAIEEIRRIVYAMRPPALDELGLVPALRQQAAGLHSRGGRPLAVRVEAPESLPALPAAVEVAAYRIVLEALTNVARHTTSLTASVRFALREGGLWLCVLDAAAGEARWTAGVGLSSMRERATELGGVLEAGPTPQGGRVEAFLPCPVGLSPRT
jgi:signal transduction histidine kinase